MTDKKKTLSTEMVEGSPEQLMYAQDIAVKILGVLPKGTPDEGYLQAIACVYVARAIGEAIGEMAGAPRDQVDSVNQSLMEAGNQMFDRLQALVALDKMMRTTPVAEA